VYETRFVYQLPIDEAANIASQVAKVLEATEVHPVSVSLAVDEDRAIATIIYLTTTPAESDDVIKQWRRINKTIQVERNHKINPEKFRNIALLGLENGQLRNMLAHEVERLCRKGVGSKGILDYLTECEGIVAQLKSYVESTRAPV
jgi:hypothetical protein